MTTMMKVTCASCGATVLDGVCEDCGKPARKATLVTAAMGGIEETATARTGSTATTRRFTVNYPTRGTKIGTGGTTARRRRDISTHTSTRRNALGGGLISLPEMPSQDPLKLLMAVPEVPAAKRRCPSCDKPVNRSKGFCPGCGTAYNFEPHLKAGDIVTGKYEIKGPIAFGGLGWIYLGWDQVLARWVVLKGLLNTNDEASAAAAVAERRYLAAVKHSKIVGIYDFVNHGAEGFIIMEYVGGQTVHSLRRQRGPLPVAEAVAYILGILPAFAYLHAQGMVYCDFKPDNLMLEAGDVKLIDMGAVRRIGDSSGDIYATVGFSAPEADADPVAVSDLYSVGRTLAVLLMDFKFTSTCLHSLPPPEEQTVLAEHESLYRFLLRATHVDPDERFQSADEMADQLFGVLREIVALASGPKPADSKVFTGDNLVQGAVAPLLAGPRIEHLPDARVNLEARGASEVIRVLSLMDPAQQLDEMRALSARAGAAGVEPSLRLAELMIRQLEVNASPRTADAEIESLIAAREAADPFDWRPAWLRGLWLLRQSRGAEALVQFERVYFEMPGELAPRLAMGAAAELAGNYEQALPYYDRVGRVDLSYASAHLGAARCHAKAGRLMEAIDAVLRIPASHALYNTGRLVVGELLIAHPAQVTEPLLRQAERALAAALQKGGAAHQVAARLFAMACGLTQQLAWHNGTFLGQEYREVALRREAEAQYRLAARLATSEPERFRLIGLANQVRPVTTF
jgi:serine/threonine-protein kinase PknG